MNTVKTPEGKKQILPIRLDEREEQLLQRMFEQFERRCPSPHLVLFCEEQEYLNLRAKFF